MFYMRIKEERRNGHLYRNVWVPVIVFYKVRKIKTILKNDYIAQRSATKKKIKQ